MSWVLAVVAAGAVASLVVPRPRPRRFPEDDPAGVQARRSGATTVEEPRGGFPRRAPSAGSTRGRLPYLPGGGRSRSRPTADSAIAGDLWDLAHCCDLLAVAASCGFTVAGSIEAVGCSGRGPVADALGRAGAELRKGLGVADAISVLRRDLGPSGQALITTLSTAASSGAPPAAALVRLADSERRRARRRVEARVRRLPVLLLIPLVGFVLPAFVLLTVVPVALSAASGPGSITGATSTAGVSIPLPPPVPAIPRGGQP